MDDGCRTWRSWLLWHKDMAMAGINVDNAVILSIYITIADHMLKTNFPSLGFLSHYSVCSTLFTITTTPDWTGRLNVLPNKSGWFLACHLPLSIRSVVSHIPWCSINKIKNKQRSSPIKWVFQSMSLTSLIFPQRKGCHSYPLTGNGWKRSLLFPLGLSFFVVVFFS